MLKYWFSLVFSLILFRNSWAQDMESVNHFFKLVDTLEADRPLSDSLWRQFLQVEGNQLFIQTNGVPDQHLEKVRRAWEILFRPSNDSLLQSSLKKDPLLANLYPYKKHQKALRDYAAWLQQHNMFDTIYVRATEWLPKRMHPVKKAPYIYYIMLDHSGSANKDGLINALWPSYELSHFKNGAYEGHEMHHFLRKSAELRPVQASHKEVLRALEALLTEGTADLVDMQYWAQTETNGKYFKQMLAQSPRMIEDLNTELESQAQGRAGKDRAFYNQLFAGTNGHFPGYFMAQNIVANGYKNKLIQAVDNSFTFLYLYNKAAKKAQQLPVFSRKSIRFVRKLERLYRVP